MANDRSGENRDFIIGNTADRGLLSQLGLRVITERNEKTAKRKNGERHAAR